MANVKIFVCQEAEWGSRFNQIKMNNVQKSFSVHACTQNQHLQSSNWIQQLVDNHRLVSPVQKCDLMQQTWQHLCSCSCSCSCTNPSHQKTHALPHPGSCTWDNTCSNTCAQTTKKPLWVEVKPVPNCDVLCGHQILGWRLCACPQSMVPDALVCTSTLSWVRDAS